MTEKELFRLIRAYLLTWLPQWGAPVGVVVSKTYQPTQEARNVSGPQLLMVKVGGRRYGSRGIYEKWDTVAGEKVRTVRTPMECSIQFNALLEQTPGDMSQPTAAELLGWASDCLQMEELQTMLKASNAGVLRITDLQHTQFENDKGQREVSPSFTAIITYQSERTFAVPVATSYDVSIKSV